MSRSLPHQERLDFFQRFVVAVVRATQPSVVHFKNSDKVLAAADYLSSVATEEPAFLDGALNVRMFNINGPGNEVLMDTLGLSAYGLADFECRFSGYNPGEIAGVLTNIAYYVFDTGDQIRSNSTVQGIGKNPIWKTNYADSKVEPSRLVVEVIPN
jgi:hypothetical protein